MWRASAAAAAAAAHFVERFDFVGDVRGIGLMAGIEMVADKSRRSTLPKGSELPQRVATGRPTGAA
jgi:putrescine aminotransferase